MFINADLLILSSLHWKQYGPIRPIPRDWSVCPEFICFHDNKKQKDWLCYLILSLWWFNSFWTQIRPKNKPGPKLLDTLWWCSWKNFSKKVDLEKKIQHISLSFLIENWLSGLEFPKCCQHSKQSRPSSEAVWSGSALFVRDFFGRQLKWPKVWNIYCIGFRDFFKISAQVYNGS